MATSAHAKARQAWEGFGPDDPESGRARGQAEPRPGRGTSKDPVYGGPTKGDNAQLKREAKTREADDARRYGGGPPGSGRTGRPAAPRSTSSPGSAGRKLLGAGGGSVAEDAGGFLLAVLVAYPMFINFVRGGSPQVRQWLAAKLINKTTDPGIAPGSRVDPGTGAVIPGTQPPNLRIDPNTGRLGAAPGTASPGTAPPSTQPGGGLIPPGLFRTA